MDNLEGRPPTTSRLLDHRSDGSHHGEKMGVDHTKLMGPAFVEVPRKLISVPVERHPRYTQLKGKVNPLQARCGPEGG